MLIAALAILAGRGLRPQATFLGAGDDRPRYEARARELGLDGVRFLDPRPTREALTFGKVLVLSSLAESMPYVILEAGAAGIPIIASNVGGLPEILGADSPCLVPAGDAETLADTSRTRSKISPVRRPVPHASAATSPPASPSAAWPKRSPTSMATSSPPASRPDANRLRRRARPSTPRQATGADFLIREDRPHDVPPGVLPASTGPAPRAEPPTAVPVALPGRLGDRARSVATTFHEAAIPPSLAEGLVLVFETLCLIAAGAFAQLIWLGGSFDLATFGPIIGAPILTTLAIQTVGGFSLSLLRRPQVRLGRVLSSWAAVTGVFAVTLIVGGFAPRSRRPGIPCGS